MQVWVYFGVMEDLQRTWASHFGSTLELGGGTFTPSHYDLSYFRK